MECYICEQLIPKEHNYTIVDDKYCCLKCDDVRLFLEDNKKPKKEKEVIIKKEPLKVTNYIKCMRCSHKYEGAICPKCNLPNPLYRSNIKRKKNKRK